MYVKVLDLHLVDICLSIFNPINSDEALSLDIVRMERPIAAK
jgi:hypothetical protein